MHKQKLNPPRPIQFVTSLLVSICLFGGTLFTHPAHAVRPNPALCENQVAIDQPFSQRQTVRFVFWNIRNLLVKLGRYSVAESVQKGLPIVAKEKELQDYIKYVLNDLNADYVSLIELESDDAFQHATTSLFDGQYSGFQSKSNDGRGLRNGLYVRNSLGHQIKYVEDVPEFFIDPMAPGYNVEPLHRRGFPLLYLYSDTAGALTPPAFILSTFHNKSQGTKETFVSGSSLPKRTKVVDEKSSRHRTAQIDHHARIAEELRYQYGDEFRFIIGGDVNTDAHNSRELRSLNQILQEAISSSPNPPPHPERVTHIYEPHAQLVKQGKEPPGIQAHQLDAAFLSPQLARRIVRAGVYHFEDNSGKPREYMDKNGFLYPYPQSYQQREMWPVTDHFPIYVDIDVSDLN